MSKDGKEPVATSKSVQRNDPIISVQKRNRELEKRSTNILKTNVILALALMLAVAGNVYQGTRRVEPRYFAQDPVTGALTPLVPLNQPMGSTSGVIQHAADAVRELNSLDFLNYRGQLQRASQYFTSSGWNRYLTEFQATGNQDSLIKKQLVSSGVVTQPPVVVAEGELFGAKYWDLEVPYRVRYMGAGFDQSVALVAKVKIIRVKVTENPKGIAIAEIITKQGGM